MLKYAYIYKMNKRPINNILSLHFEIWNTPKKVKLKFSFIQLLKK